MADTVDPWSRTWITPVEVHCHPRRRRPTMVFNHRSTVEHVPLGTERQAWEGLEAKALV